LEDEMTAAKTETTHEDYLEHLNVIRRLRGILRGETVDGLKIGDAGITREWVERCLEAYKGFVTPILFPFQ
jgi:hypothetical protein